MAKSGDWNLTRADLWAVPGVVLMAFGFVLLFSSDRGVGQVLMFIGIGCNTVFVLRRTGREQRRKAARGDD